MHLGVTKIQGLIIIKDLWERSSSIRFILRLYKTIRSTLFNFNKIVTDINIDSNTPDS